MKALNLAGMIVLLAVAPTLANDVTWTLVGTSQVTAGQPVTWQAYVQVSGQNQGLAGYAFNIAVGPGTGPTAGPDGVWGTGDDENLSPVQLSPATFESVFQVSGSSPPPGNVTQTGSAGGPGMNVLPQVGTNSLIPGELLQVGASYIDWAAFPGSDGQTAGVGVAGQEANLLANPAGGYLLNSGAIPTAGLPDGVYTVRLIPVATRTLRADLDFSQDHQGFIMQSANATGSSFSFVVGVPVIPADFDDDGDVDGDDLLVFESCATGPDLAYDPFNLGSCPLTPDGSNRIEADFDSDGDVDQDDFAVYQKCYSGPGAIGNPACAQ